MNTETVTGVLTHLWRIYTTHPCSRTRDALWNRWVQQLRPNEAVIITRVSSDCIVIKTVTLPEKTSC